MSDYNVPLDLDTKNSASILMDMVENGSSVLEFGAAYGRMTKYLTNEKKCKVDIVEINEEAFQNAMQYADVGFCGDIEKYEWIETFKGKKYDYIMFADVLEHLYDPQKVLSACHELLKPNGSILISIPNIAHSAILISLFNNDFTYNPEGLLDETHIRFFTYYTIKKLIRTTKLEVVREESTDLLPEHTEFMQNVNILPDILKSAFMKKDFAGSYQFVFECKKRAYLIHDNPNPPVVRNILPSIAFDGITFFFSEKNNFSENNIIKKRINFGENSITLNFPEYDKVHFVRIDISEHSSYVKMLSLSINGKKIDQDNLKGNFNYQNEEDFFFLENDPHFIISEENETITNISIEFKYDFIDNKYLFEKIKQDFFKQYNTLEADSKKENLNLKQKNNSLSQYCENLRRETEKIKQETEKLKQEINNLQTKNILAKDSADAKAEQYDHIVNSTSWKVTKPLRYIADKIKTVKRR